VYEKFAVAGAAADEAAEAAPVAWLKVCWSALLASAAPVEPARARLRLLMEKTTAVSRGMVTW
jgi:hypothetical protein